MPPIKLLLTFILLSLPISAFGKMGPKGTIRGGEDNRIPSSQGGVAEALVKATGYIKLLLLNEDNVEISRTCSGGLVAKDIIVTAAHCLILDPEEKLSLVSAFFVPGVLDNRLIAFGRYPILKVYAPDFYVPHYVDAEFDFAYAKLGPGADGKAAGDHVNWVWAWGNREEPTSAPTGTIGYPGYSTFQFYEKDCRADTHPDDYLIDTLCDTATGQSGSPLFRYSEKFKRYYFFGVLSGVADYSTTASKVNPARQKVLLDIETDKFNSDDFVDEDKFIMHELPQKSIFSVLAKNSCDKDLYLAFYLKDLDGQEKTIGFVEVKSGTTKATINSIARHIGVASSFDRAKSFTNKKDFVANLNERSDKVPFQRYNLVRNGDNLLVFDCK